METPIQPPTRTQADLVVNTVAWFSAEMRSKMFENLHKGGWRDCAGEVLLERLVEETEELRKALKNGAPREIIAAEAADVANFAMMIADPGRRVS